MVDKAFWQGQYEMLLRLVYGNRETLISDLEKTIELYKQSPNVDSHKCQARINYYKEIIKIATEKK